MDATARLRHIVARAQGLPFYRERLAGVDVARLDAADLGALPFLERSDLEAAFADEPDGGFLTDDIVQMHLTPMPRIGRMPEYLTRNDLTWQGEAIAAWLERCGVRPGDRCLVAFSYHMVAGGWLFHEGLVRLGAVVLALGPGEAERAVEIARRHAFRVLVANPSFARRLGEAGGRFDVLVAAGEPFTAVPGLREATEAAIGGRAFDAYGLSEAGIVAAETEAGGGMRPLDEAAILEVLEPGGARPVAEGEKGELVVTSLTREGMPLLRFRTGDLTLKGLADGALYLPRGVFGRTDGMIKLKGIKFFPRELTFLLAGTPGADPRHYQVRVSSGSDGTDRVALHLQRAGGEPDLDALVQRVRSATGVRLDEVVFEEAVAGEVLVDERYDDGRARA